MNHKLKTIIAFTKNVFTTGAFSETSEKVEKEICKYVPTEDNKVIVEYGMGHGNITQEILKTMSPSSTLYAFEVKKEFCDYVKNRIKDDRLIIVNDGAENIDKYVTSEIHSVITSIPFSFFSEEKGMSIIEQSYSKLSNMSYCSQVLYTKFNFKKFQKVFDNNKLICLGGFPREYIYHCQKIID